MAMSAEAMNEIFRSSVNAAQECAKKTKDEGQKGIIYATLALAMANTGVVSVELSEAAEMTPKAEATREDLKPKAAKKFTKQSAPANEAPKKKGSEDEPSPNDEPQVEDETETQQEALAEEEQAFGAEWTDEAVEHFAAETEFVQNHQAKLYEMYYAAAEEEGQSEDEASASAQQATIEYFNSEVERATAGTCHSADDINPMNIKYIVEFLKAIERGEEPAEGAYLPY